MKYLWSRNPWRGVITSSWPARRNEAGSPLTVRRGIENPRRSRSKRERFCVAFAVMTARERIWFVAWSQSIFKE